MEYMKSNFKKYVLLLFLFAIIVEFTTSCKKDYPSDIPDWLKNKIRSIKEFNGGCSGSNCGCIVMDEYKFKDSCTVFLFSCTGDGVITLWDNGGNSLCLRHYGTNNWRIERGSIYQTSNILFESDRPPIVKTRHIWSGRK